MPAANVEDALALELLVRLRHRAWIDDQLRGELAHRGHRILRAHRPDDERPPHLVHDLEVERPRVMRIEVHQQGVLTVAVLYTCATLHQWNQPRKWLRC